MNLVNEPHRRSASPAGAEKSKTTFRPLSNLKYAYSSKSRETSVTGQVSVELPLISSKFPVTKSDHHTKTVRYTRTINDIFKMKLKLAQLNDEISLIDLRIHEDTVKFEKAVSQHEAFTRSFEEFLTNQYEKVKAILRRLRSTEKDSQTLKSTLTKLQNDLVKKSLQIYELESVWRRYKTSRDFILHLSGLLSKPEGKRTTPFRNLQLQKESVSLNDLIEYFRVHNNAKDDVPFDLSELQHVAPGTVMAFLFALKRQNLKLLRCKLHYEKVENNFQRVRDCLEENVERELSNVIGAISDTCSEAKEIEAQSERVRKGFEDGEVEITVPNKEATRSLYKFVENLYSQCFSVDCQGKSHVQMIKSVEDYCCTLLHLLGSFEPHVVKKAVRLSRCY